MDGSSRTTKIKTQRVKLQDIYDALTSEQRYGLYRGNYNPDDIVMVSYTIEVNTGITKLIEDFAMEEKPKRRRRKTKQSPPGPPSKVHGKAYYRWVDNPQDVKLDASVIFGRYLILYKELLGEEDPNWVGQSPRKALFIINKFANDLTNGNFEPLLEFIDKLIPLWIRQLKLGEEFPNFRPDIDSLFVRRKFWAQRYNHYKRWSR